MQCKPVTSLPKGSGWTYEIKFEGYRALAVNTERRVKLFRNENVLNGRFPKLTAVLERLPGEFAIDREIFALDEQGRPSFQLLQNSQTRTLPVHFYAFDLLHRMANIG